MLNVGHRDPVPSRPLYVSIPAAYIESDTERSPYTVYRDTCIHYTSVDVDSGVDSLRYLFPYLNERKDYALLVEFYTECDSAATLQIKVGSDIDTLEIPGGGEFSWYETNIPSGTDSLKLTIKRIPSAGFVPVSRVIARRRTDAGMYTMGMAGPALEKPVPIPFCLYQPYPNPFSSAATIRYSLPYATHVSLKVYDVAGRRVRTLVDENKKPGIYELNWDGKDNASFTLPAGVYFIRFETEDFEQTKKAVLLK